MKIIKNVLKWVIYVGLVATGIIIAILGALNIVTRASNDRDWQDDQAILPYADIDGNIVTIHNIRNFAYASTTSYTPNYYDKTFDLSKIKRVWYVVSPFSGIPGSAHTFLSFEFEGEQFVSISVEIRKQKGETYHPVKGFFNKYELMYVIADEHDVIKLRTNYRKDKVYLYPARTTTDKARELFLSMINRANTLKDHPEFYNTITNNCTTNIVRHINTIAPNRVPLFDLDVFLPADSDRLAYDLGLIDTDLPFSELRQQSLINERAMQYGDDPAFSTKIRE